MRYSLWRLLLVAITASALLAAGSQAGATEQNQKYLRLYEKVADKEGKRAPGRNIVKWGMPNGKDAKRSQITESIEVLQRILNPPPAPVVAVAADSVAAPTVGTSYSSGVPAELESIAQCESGGDYSAVNASSGAYGKYQILPSTAAAYGCDLATPAGQDACATEIYAGGAGRGQWVC